MPMEGDFMGDQDMPQPPQDNNQVKNLSLRNFSNICETALTSYFQVAAWYDTDLQIMHLCQRLQMLVSEKRYLSVICPISEKAQAKLFPGKVQL